MHCKPSKKKLRVVKIIITFTSGFLLIHRVFHADSLPDRPTVFHAGNITRHPAYRHYLQAFPGADQVMKVPTANSTFRWFFLSEKVAFFSGNHMGFHKASKKRSAISGGYVRYVVG